MVDSIPIRLAPLPGEDIDSYLRTYARLLHAEVSDILSLAGLAGRPSTAKLGHRPWTYRLDPVEADALAVVTGLRPQTLAAMTLARYDGTGLLSGVRPTGRPRPPRWWNQLKGSRFCPRCLTGNGGRWMLAWRLPWTFACTRHHLLLVDICPACGRAHRPALDRPPRDPGRCDTTGLALPSHPRGRQPPACTAPLTDTATIPLDPHGPVLAAQQYVDQLIEALANAQPETAASQRTRAARQGLDDLHAAARAALLALTAPPPPPDTVTAVLAELDADGPNAPAGPPHQGDRRRRPTDTAAGVTIAHLMLAGQPGDPDPAITDWLIDVAVHKGQTSPKLLLRRWENTSPELHAALLHRLTPHLNITYQMRYSTTATQPRRPQAGHGRTRAAAVPGLFWRGWALRLNPSGLLDSLSYRTTLSALLLLAGTDKLSYRDAIGLLGRPVTPGSQPTPIVIRLREAGVLDTVTGVLDQLAVALDTHGSPIDYGRRRRWKRLTNPDFDEHAWHRQCTQTRARRLASPRPTIFARLYLAELLTGIHPHHLPPPARLTATDRPDYANFVRRLPTTLDDYLHHQARRILARANIREPLEWEPPLNWISPITWPGPDPASTPRGDQWARTPSRTPADTPTDPPHPPSTEQLRAYVAQGLGPRQIAKATHCPPPLINQLLTTAGLTRPAPRDVLVFRDSDSFIYRCCRPAS